MPQSFPPSTDVETLLRRYAEGQRDFSGIHLNEASLAGAKLDHIILKHAHLKVVNLSTANLSHSDLCHAVLNVSRLSGANLSQAQLQYAQLNVANLIRAVMIGSNLRGASLVRSELLRADLSNANLSDSNLQEADLREARLRWANLERANLSRTNLRHSNLLGANFNYVKANSINLEGSKLEGASLISAELRHANLRSADLSGTNLRGANLRWANLSGANLQDADLTDTKLSGADLLGAQLEGAMLENTTLVHTDLTRSNLRNIRCVGADLSGATVTGAQMHGAIAYDVQTHDVICDWIDLSPQGDQSQKRYFDTDNDIHTFFNQRPPQVTVVVDGVMTLEAHTVLARVYANLGALSAVLHAPPNLELTNRRTLITFFGHNEMGLSAIAYLATWPFQDGRFIRQALMMLMRQSQEDPDQSLIYKESYRELQQVIEALQPGNLAPLRHLIDEHGFFATPLQVTLLNSHGHQLELYTHPRFGIRTRPTADGLSPVTSAPPTVPDINDYFTFLMPSNEAKPLSP